MRILIVDDEQLALSRLERLLRELGEQDIKIACDATTALELCQSIQFDIAFLDINLPDMLGTQLASIITEKNSAATIIFQTAHDNYAIKAFEIGAIDYLLKPYSKEQLRTALDRARKQTAKKPPFFIIKDDGEYVTVSTNDIYYIEADLTQSIIRTKELFLYYPKKISQMDEILAPHGFFRVHRSAIVNTSKIKKISTAQQSRLIFSFWDIDDTLKSSKEGAKLFRHRFGDLS